MRQEVIARQVAAMAAAGLDAIVSISPENFAYVTGFLSPTQPLMRWRHAMVVVTADGAAALLDRMPVRRVDDDRDSSRAFELARRYDNWPVYDMVYVAVA